MKSGRHNNGKFTKDQIGDAYWNLNVAPTRCELYEIKPS